MLVIMGSARHDGCTYKVLNEVLPKNGVDFINLSQLSIADYAYAGNYPDHDDFLGVAEKMAQVQQIVFATPVYWYAMSGVLKKFFDRLSDLLGEHKALGRKLAGRTTYALATGTGDALPSGFDVPFALTSSYFDMVWGGMVYVRTHDNYLQDYLRDQARARDFFTNFQHKGTVA